MYRMKLALIIYLFDNDYHARFILRNLQCEYSLQKTLKHQYQRE
jgi:hypothetical protein